MTKLKDILRELLDTSKELPYDTKQVLPKKKKGEEEEETDGKKLKPSASHTFSDGSVENSYKWNYTNPLRQKMQIEINYQAEADNTKPKMVISFGKFSKSSEVIHSAMTGAGDLKKILKTVTDSAESVIAKELPGLGKRGLYAVGFEPADKRRERIYRYFIEANFPDFKEDSEGGESRKSYKWFINQNYQPPQTKTSEED